MRPPAFAVFALGARDAGRGLRETEQLEGVRIDLRIEGPRFSALRRG
jgi:hypothetical protein